MKYSSIFRKAFLVFLILISCTKTQKPQGPDTSAPYVKIVISLDTTKVLVSFNEELNPDYATDTLNYLITSYETLDVHIVNIDPMIKNCILGTEPQESTFYEIDIKNIKDVSGNEMKDTTITFHGVGVMPDSFAPTVRIEIPGEGDTLYGFELFWVDAHDNTGVKTVSFFINDSFIEEDKYIPYFCYLDVRGLQEGEVYTIYASAMDYSANVGYSESLNVFIGFHPPFPYVIIDTVYTTKTPFRGDITDDGTKYFFVQTDTSGNDLVIVNTVTNSVERTMRLYTGASYFLDVFKNSWVYFTSGNSFVIFDISLDQVVGTVNIGGDARGIVRSNNEKLYIARHSEQDVVVYSTQDYSIIDSIPVPGSPTALAIDTVHNEVYACLFDEYLIAVIDIEGDTSITNISVSGNPFGVVFSPNCDRAYVSELDNNAVGVIETSNHTVLDEVYPFGLRHPKGIAVADNGDYLFVGSEYEVLVLNTFDYSIEWDLKLGLYPYSIVFTPSYERVYIVCMNAMIFCIGY